MTKEEAKEFGLRLLHGIMERNESYPVYANNVKQAIEVLSEPSGSSEIPNDLEEAAEEYAKGEGLDDALGGWEDMHDAFIAGAKWQEGHTPLPEDTVLFIKGIEEGKRLMMEEMSECFAQLKQVQSESINMSYVREQLAYNRGASDERYKMRKKMIEEAVEGEVCIPNVWVDHKEGKELVVRAEISKELGFKFGDKVRIIIIKEDKS